MDANDSESHECQPKKRVIHIVFWIFAPYFERTFLTEGRAHKGHGAVSHDGSCGCCSSDIEDFLQFKASAIL